MNWSDAYKEFIRELRARPSTELGFINHPLFMGAYVLDLSYVIY